MSLPHLVTSRRTALGGALAGLVTVTGCDDGPPPNDPASGPTTAPAPDADTELVDRVTTDIVTALGAVLEVRASNRKLRATLRPLARLHGAHLTALDAAEADVPTDASGTDAPGIQRVRVAELRLQRQLTDAAVDAESGALAGLLASMAAAIAQHLAVLP